MHVHDLSRGKLKKDRKENLLFFSEPLYVNIWRDNPALKAKHVKNDLPVHRLEEQKAGSTPLAKQYIDARGKKRCHGLKRRLKRSQPLDKIN